MTDNKIVFKSPRKTVDAVVDIIADATEMGAATKISIKFMLKQKNSEEQARQCLIKLTKLLVDEYKK